MRAGYACGSESLNTTNFFFACSFTTHSPPVLPLIRTLPGTRSAQAAAYIQKLYLFIPPSVRSKVVFLPHAIGFYAKELAETHKLLQAATLAARRADFGRGDSVLLHSLSAPSFNGKRGTVTGAINNGRFPVFLDGGTVRGPSRQPEAS